MSDGNVWLQGGRFNLEPLREEEEEEAILLLLLFLLFIIICYRKEQDLTSWTSSGPWDIWLTDIPCNHVIIPTNYSKYFIFSYASGVWVRNTNVHLSFFWSAAEVLFSVVWVLLLWVLNRVRLESTELLRGRTMTRYLSTRLNRCPTVRSETDPGSDERAETVRKGKNKIK